jgi:outer membrane protein OmpA-like peptidoglycan-associated protein
VYDVAVRLGAALVTLLTSVSAHAEPRVEASAFLGVDDFGDQIKLGNGLAPEQRPQTAPLVGVRGTLLFLQISALELGIEPELTFTGSWTGYGFDGPRVSTFAPVLGYRGSLLVRVQLGDGFSVHASGGAGGESVFASSMYLSSSTDLLLFYGVGATVALGGGWQLRLDARQGFMPAKDGGTTEIYEAMFGVGLRFGEPAPLPPVVVVPPPKQPLLPPPDPDRDGDGIPDRLDKCPDQAENKNGVEDEDGCPETDPDGDGIFGSADKCPDQAEDFDHFEDEDGCPDPDNDKDGIPDAQDKCPNQPETKNGFDDEDGCPDEIPAIVSAAFEAASAVRFDAGRAKLSEAAKAALVKVLVQLHAHPTMHVVVTGHPDKADDKGEALAKKRADVVKWYLVDQGVPVDQLESTTGDVQKAPIELHAAPPTPH